MAGMAAAAAADSSAPVQAAHRAPVLHGDLQATCDRATAEALLCAELGAPAQREEARLLRCWLWTGLGYPEQLCPRGPHAETLAQPWELPCAGRAEALCRQSLHRRITADAEREDCGGGRLERRKDTHAVDCYQRLLFR